MTQPELLHDSTEEVLPDSVGALPDSAAHAGRPRDEAREQAILDAAVTVLAEVGYDRMTMDAVASAAKASKATIYRRWPGKAELVSEALRRRVITGEGYPDAGSLRADLAVFVNRVCSHIGGLDGGLLCGLAAATRADPELAACVKRNLIDNKASKFDEILGRAARRHEVAPGVTGDVLLEVVPAVAVMRAMKGDALDDAFAAHLVDDIAIPLLTFLSPDQTGTPPDQTDTTLPPPESKELAL